MLKDLNAQERDTITFEVNVNYEGITYKWLKNGVEIKSSDRCQVRSKQLTHTLSIRNVHFGDGGEYQFTAGSAATAANLFVEGIQCSVQAHCCFLDIFVSQWSDQCVNFFSSSSG